MSNSILIRGGRIIDPSQGMDATGDLLIRDGVVAALKAGGGLPAPAGTPVVDARGLIVTPGFVDLHAHLRQPGFEEKENIATGTRAAARGGFTTLCCMPNTEPAIDSRATIEFILATAKSAGLVRVWPIAAVTVGRQGKQLTEMAELAAAGAVAFSDDGSPVADARLMRSALAYCTRLGLPISDHCEDPVLARGVMHEGGVSSRLGLPGSPAAAEDVMVARDIMLAEVTGGRVHIAHLSTAGAVDLVRQAKAKRLPVTAEAAPHHLTLTDEWVAGGQHLTGHAGSVVHAGCGPAYDTNCKVNPPLRSKEHVEAVIEGLREGVIDAIATDHAPHTVTDKLCEFENAAYGITGLETALGSVLSLVHQSRISLPALVDRLTWGPAKIIDHAKIGIGTLRPGAPGDVAVFDPDAEWQVDAQAFASKGKNTPLHGERLRGAIVVTVFAGTLVHDARSKGKRS
ncbi:MAG: dihydroorotase [Dehalococcoidia bacterium]|nr:dihydroorotase [Dehalococcoidia bacterium]